MSRHSGTWSFRRPLSVALAAAATVTLGSVLIHALLARLGTRSEVADWTDFLVFGTLGGLAALLAVRHHRRVLEESESRFRLFVEGLDAIFWEAVPDPPAFTFVSHRAETKLGYPVESWFDGFNFWAGLIHPDDREKAVRDCAEEIRCGRDHVLTYRMVAKDGKVVWIEDQVRVETDREGRPVRLTGVMVDVTERMRIQEDLERELAVSAGLMDLKQELLRATSLQEICEATLARARALTGSPYGFVAQVEPESGDLVILAATPEVCAGIEPPPRSAVLGFSGGLMGWVREYREPVLSNDVPRDPRSKAKIPPGHLSIERFLTVPALHGDALAGQIAVANAPRDYTPHDVKVLQLLAPNVALSITRLRAQQSLEESRGQLQAMVSSAMDAIVSADESGRVVVFNTAAESMFGVPARDAIGAPLERFIPERFRYVDREGEASYISAVGGRAAVASGIGLRADGTVFPLEASVSTVRVGAHELSTAILRDLTERLRGEEDQRRLQQALKQSTVDWRRTFDALPSAVVVLDAECRIQRLNLAGAEILGGDYAALLGRPLADVSPGEPWRSAVRLAGEGAPTARTRVGDETSGRSWDLHVTRMTEGSGSEPRTIVAAEDVTGLVRLEATIGRSEKMAAMGALTAGVAHEVRNPLFAIAASVDALGAMLTDRPKVAHLLDLMREQVSRMNQLMNELLVFGRPASTEGIGEVSLEGVVQRSLRSCTPLADAAEVAIVLEGTALGQVLRGDASRLEEVVTNLLQNAVQHSRRGGVVTLSVDELRPDGEAWVRLRVTDGGPGFRAEDMGKVFEPFFSRRAGGTGLGLSIVQRIAEQHGGRVNLGNLPGGGASVSVELPCAPVAAGQAERAPA